MANCVVLQAQVAGDEEPRRSTSRAPSFKAFRHPAVAYLSRLRDPRPDIGPGSKNDDPDGNKKRGILNNLLGGIAERTGSGGHSIQSSMMSETQMSLASLESMMSGRQPKASRLVNFLSHEKYWGQKDLIAWSRRLTWKTWWRWLTILEPHMGASSFWKIPKAWKMISICVAFSSMPRPTWNIN